VAVVKEFLSVAKITQIRATVLPQACIYEGALDHDLGAGDAGQIGAVLFDHSRGQLFANAVMAASRAGGRIAVRRRAALVLPEGQCRGYFQDATNDNAICKHVEIVIVPLA
jgi:hypothetical protein